MSNNKSLKPTCSAQICWYWLLRSGLNKSRRLWMSSELASPKRAIASSKVRAAFSLHNCCAETSGFLLWSVSLISGTIAFWTMFWSLWNFKSRLLVLDRIIDQTSGLTFVAVMFSQFAGLVQLNSFCFIFSSDHFVHNLRKICVHICWAGLIVVVFSCSVAKEVAFDRSLGFLGFVCLWTTFSKERVDLVIQRQIDRFVAIFKTRGAWPFLRHVFIALRLWVTVR